MVAFLIKWAPHDAVDWRSLQKSRTLGRSDRSLLHWKKRQRLRRLHRTDRVTERFLDERGSSREFFCGCSVDNCDATWCNEIMADQLLGLFQRRREKLGSPWAFSDFGISSISLFCNDYTIYLRKAKRLEDVAIVNASSQVSNRYAVVSSSHNLTTQQILTCFGSSASCNCLLGHRAWREWRRTGHPAGRVPPFVGYEGHYLIYLVIFIHYKGVGLLGFEAWPKHGKAMFLVHSCPVRGCFFKWMMRNMLIMYTLLHTHTYLYYTYIKTYT